MQHYTLFLSLHPPLLVWVLVWVLLWDLVPGAKCEMIKLLPPLTATLHEKQTPLLLPHSSIPSAGITLGSVGRSV